MFLNMVVMACLRAMGWLQAMVSNNQLQDMASLQLLRDMVNHKWVTVSHKWVTVNLCRATDNLCRVTDNLCRDMVNLCRVTDNLCRVMVNLYLVNNLFKGMECHHRIGSSGGCLHNRTNMENPLASERKEKWSGSCRDQARSADRDTKRLIEEETKKWRRGLAS